MIYYLEEETKCSCHIVPRTRVFHSLQNNKCKTLRKKNLIFDKDIKCMKSLVLNL